ncbi:MAG: outer membrane beta-barrel protein [Ginsengibacter sp.]
MNFILLPKYKSLLFVLLLMISMGLTKVYAQDDSIKLTIPHSIEQNAGFDVIVKLNGDIVYGLVKEVGPYYISYKRTDIPDGPVYTIARSEVYVISYRNQVKDYINGRVEDQAGLDLTQPLIDSQNIEKKQNPINLNNGKLGLGLGFLRSFSKVENKNNYSSSSSFPIVSLSYEVPYNENLQLGIMLGFGSHNFSNQNYSNYDSTNNNIHIKENIFGLYVYGRYYFMSPASQLQPYILGGLGVTSSNIHSENKISFTNDNTQTILVKSGTRTTGLGIVARAGIEYYLTKQYQVYLDAGAGLSVIKVGVSFAID